MSFCKLFAVVAGAKNAANFWKKKKIRQINHLLNPEDGFLDGLEDSEETIY